MTAPTVTLTRPAETARPRRLIGARWQELLMLLPA